MISDHIVAAIKRHHFLDGWPIGTIAAQLGLHHQTVRRVLAQLQEPAALAAPHPSILDPYLPFMRETLTKHPTLTATRLFGMVQVRGYPGRVDHFRHAVARLRPRRPSEAFLRLRTLPGEQAQVDWAHFGSVKVDGGVRKLYGFVMVLSYSRRIFLRFGYDIGMAGFVRGHVDAFHTFGGVPRVLLCDNLKSAVLERVGDLVRFHPLMLDLSDHYHYELRPVAPARGNQKGRVERAIRYIRSAFFAARRFADIDDLNAQADVWCTEDAKTRKCPGDPSMTVQQAFEMDRERLTKLAATPFETQERKELTSGKQPYLRFDRNDYSIPHTCVRKRLELWASLQRVRVFEDGVLVADHARTFAVGKTVQDERHVDALVQAKAKASRHAAMQWLLEMVPSCQPLLTRLAERHGQMGPAVASLCTLLRTYGQAELTAAVTEAMACDGVHPNSVRAILQRNRIAAQRPVPNDQLLANRKTLRSQSTARPSLVAYDQLVQPKSPSTPKEPAP